MFKLQILIQNLNAIKETTYYFGDVDITKQNVIYRPNALTFLK
jgi:hypothetical protein